jgi:cation:H+ antiporter
MPLLADIALLAAGGLLLYLGAEWLVKGAAGLARKFGVSPLVVGMTVVAYATSAPELAVTIRAALAGKSAIALGNVVGSNIANLGLILGVTALIAPPLISGSLIRREVPMLVISTLLVPIVLLDGSVSRIEGFALAGASFAFTAVLLRSRDSGNAVAEAEEGAEEAGAPPGDTRLRLVIIGLVGLAALVLGGDIFVRGAVGLAAAVGMSERVVGLTIVAVGTSLPELAASLVAAFRGHSDMAVGNIVGSNVFNVLLILGAAAILTPVEAPLASIYVDVGALGVLTLIAAVSLRTARKLSRVEGALLLLSYAAFLAALVFGLGT